jgi:hypothetical protein
VCERRNRVSDDLLDKLDDIARRTLGGNPEGDHEAAVNAWALDYPWVCPPDWLPYEETWYPLARGVLALSDRLRAVSPGGGTG